MESSSIQEKEPSVDSGIIVGEIKDLLEKDWSAPKKSLWNIFSRERRDPHLLEQLHFTEQLYSRAPKTFLTRTKVETLSSIVNETWRAYQTFLRENEPFFVQLLSFSEGDPRHASSALITVTRDRTFIIDTLQELLRNFGLSFGGLLHPIIDHQSFGSVSVVYLEFERIADSDEADRFLRTVKHTFADLVLATDDYLQMLARVREVKHALKNPLVYQPTVKLPPLQQDAEEIAEFLDYITKEHFIFLGYRRWVLNKDDLDSKARNQAIKCETSADLGLFRSENPELVQLADNIQEAKHLFKVPDIFLYSRAYCRTRIHRHRVMTVLSFKTESRDGQQLIVHSFIGLLRYFFLEQSADLAPYTRRKLEQIVTEDQIRPHTFDYRETFSIFRGLPRTRLLQADVQRIREDMTLVFRAKENPETFGNFYLDVLGRFCSILLIVPRSRFSDSVKLRIQTIIEERFGVKPGASEYDVSLIDNRLLKVHYLIPNFERENWLRRLPEVVAEVTQLTLSWEDRVAHEFAKINPHGEIPSYVADYLAALPAEFKAAATPIAAMQDIVTFESLTSDNPVEVKIHFRGSPGRQRMLLIRVFRRVQNKQIALSEVLPHFDALGFSILKNNVCEFLVGENSCVIYDLEVVHQAVENINERQINTILLPGLKKILSSKCRSDKFNELLITPGIDLKEIAVLRALSQYLLQIIPIRESVVIAAILDHPEVVRCILDFFRIKFDPTLHPDDPASRAAVLSGARERLSQSLGSVESSADENILSVLASIVDSTVRTNFFQLAGEWRIAFKLQSKQSSDLPATANCYEYFVYSPEFQGIYITAAKIACGKIQVARRADYRKETVEGVWHGEVSQAGTSLAGACGSFVFESKLVPGEDPEEKKVTAFGWFAFCLLQLTDNISKSGEIVHPKNAICYDGPDPFLLLVVGDELEGCAKCGCEIALRDFDYWLGDCFILNDGERDRKKWLLELQADGIWATIEHHAREIGLSPSSSPFRVVVCGGPHDAGLWQSLVCRENIELLAAVDGTHIFVDPRPQVENGAIERRKLSALKNPSWDNYDVNSISPGGGIFRILDSEIPLTPELRELTNLEDETVSGKTLASALLKLPADVLILGQTDTLVVGNNELLPTGSDIHSGLLLYGQDLRARIVVETDSRVITAGGRADYAQKGGKINGTSLDNFALTAAMEELLQARLVEIVKNNFSRHRREPINEVCSVNAIGDAIRKRVLERQRVTQQYLSVEVKRSRDRLSEYVELVKTLEKEGMVDRRRDALADDEEFARRQLSRAGLLPYAVRVIADHTKICLFDRLVKSRFVGDPIGSELLEKSWPIFSSLGPDKIEMQPLKQELIASEFANFTVDVMGPTFVQRHVLESGSTPVDAVRALMAARVILNYDELEKQLAGLDTAEKFKLYQKGLRYLSRTLNSMSRWFLECRSRELKLHELVARYREPFSKLFLQRDLITDSELAAQYKGRVGYFTAKGFPRACAELLTSLQFAPWCLDIIDIAIDSSRDSSDVARLYIRLMSELGVPSLLDYAHEVKPKNHWDTLAVQAMGLKIQKSIHGLSAAIIREHGSADAELVRGYLGKHKSVLERFNLTQQQLGRESIGVSGLIVAASQLSSLVK